MPVQPPFNWLVATVLLDAYVRSAMLIDGVSYQYELHF